MMGNPRKIGEIRVSLTRGLIKKITYVHSNIISVEIPDETYDHDITVMPKNLNHSVPDSNIPFYTIHGYVKDFKVAIQLLQAIKILSSRRYADNDKLLLEEKGINPLFDNIPIESNAIRSRFLTLKQKRKKYATIYKNSRNS